MKELPHVRFFRDQLGLLAEVANSFPPEGLNEILLKELVFQCLDSVGTSTKGINRNKSFSEMIEDPAIFGGLYCHSKALRFQLRIFL